jgi:CRISPR-associated endonuclease Csn1
MKLKNTLVAGAKGQRKLTVEEIRKIYAVVSADVQQVKPDAKDWAKKIASRLSLTATSWGQKKGVKELGLFPLSGHEEVKPPKHSGRSGFSRPALRLLRQLILSGKSPHDFCPEQVAELGGNTDEKKGLVPRDLKFLNDMGDSWDDIRVPAQKLDALAARHTENGKLDVDKAVPDLLAGINDPVVRHRLHVFADRLRYLRAEYGEPQEVVLEFIRQDFMGPKRKAELLQFQREREKARKEAREKATEAGAEEKSAALKYELCKAQGCICLYCGQPFAAAKLDEYEIEHIVPRSQSGPDAMVNYVLAHRQCNEAKGELTPFQWKHGKEGWDGYKKLVDSCGTALRNKKVQLLLREDAPKLVQRYTALAETAWVSKLAQTIASLFFGWENGNDKQGRKRVTVISGGLTGRIRRKYRLNSILNPCPDGEDPFLWEEKCEKNRDDDRHHALDAMVISFLPTWARDPNKEGFFRFPEGVHQEYFARAIESVHPRNIALEKPAFEETFYGLRNINEHKFIVGRESLAALAIKVVNNRETLKARKDIETHRIIDGQIRRDVEDFWKENASATLEAWKAWCHSYRLGGRGARVENVLVTKSKADSIEEYKDVAKHDGAEHRGQFKRGAKHRGYFIYERPAPTKNDAQRTQIEVRPVFVFEGKQSVNAGLREHSDWRIHGFFEAGCQVHMDKDWQFQGKCYPAGEYILRSVWANRNAKLKHPHYGEIGPVGLRILLDAGFK